MKRAEITYKRAKDLFRYDVKTGELYWKKRTSNRIKIGERVGTLLRMRGKKVEYLATSVDGQKLLVHRIVWLLRTGKMPKFEIGHEDGNGLNNRFGNLDDITTMKNNRNLPLRSDNTSGVLGVSKHSKVDKWVVQFTVAGKNRYGGLYNSFEKAVAARKRISKENGFHKNHGRLK